MKHNMRASNPSVVTDGICLWSAQWKELLLGTCRSQRFGLLFKAHRAQRAGVVVRGK